MQYRTNNTWKNHSIRVSQWVQEKKKKRIDSHTHRDPYTWNWEFTLPENVGECERELEAFSERETETYEVYEWQRKTE